MKKIGLILLGLILVLMVACSADSPEDTAFLDTVKGKKIIFLGTDNGYFSNDGKEYTENSGFTLKFDKATSATEANYTVKGVDYTFSIGNNKLSITMMGSVPIIKGTLTAK